MSIRYIERFPTPEEYNMLTDSVGWGTRKISIIEEALKKYIVFFMCL